MHIFQHYPSLVPARISFATGGSYTVMTETGLVKIKSVKSVIHHDDTYPFPVIGDWVVMDNSVQEPVIKEILMRKNTIQRQAAGKTSLQQIIAANIDIFFLVTSCNRDFNLSRLERYLTLTWESNAVPIIILNKTDSDPDLDARLQEVHAIAPGVVVEGISARYDTSTEKITRHLKKGLTGILLGSSGVGKSTIVNKLMQQDVLETKEVRQGDNKGRHTTTSREMFVIPEGGILMDTPGLREIKLLDNQEGLENTFSDIEALAKDCHFADCKHETEPLCNVLKAVEKGRLDERRLRNYQKMQQEITYYNERKSSSNKKRKWKGIAKLKKEIKKLPKYK